MSALQEEDLLQKLQLFESVVPHASISWDEPQKVCVKRRSKEFLIPEGEYLLKDLAEGSHLNELQGHRNSIDHKTAEINTVITYQGKKLNVKCATQKTNGSVHSLWVVIPEKDNSILYLQNAAHDFRSPLGSIIGVANLMQHSIKNDSEIDPEEMTTLIDMIKLNTDKALNLASEIMELAEIESDTYELKKVSVVMKDFVQTYLDTHRLLTLKKRIQVEFKCHTNASTMLNESKMTRALDNVMTNAVKFSHDGTKITFVLIEEEHRLKLSIIDEGIGMSKQILDNLFVKFGDAKRNGLDGEPTHGLGMSIVRQIMHLHGGEVSVRSEDSKGTQVDLILNKEG